jgi:hypothetical protein
LTNDLSLYRNRYRQHGGKQISCFYAAPKGVNPIAKEKPWFNYIDYAEELLNIKATRINTKELNVTAPSLSKETTTANIHKKKVPQNHENSEHNSIEALPFEEVNIPPSKLKVHHWNLPLLVRAVIFCQIMDCCIEIEKRQQNCLCPLLKKQTV